VGLISVEQYQEDLEKAVANLQGRSESILNGLTEQMQKAVLEQDYEVASQLRDQVLCFRLVMQTQSVVDPHWIDTVKEVIGLARNAFGVSVVVLLMSKGKLVSVRHFALQNTDPQDSSSHLLSQFLMQHYAENPCEASELLISEPFEDPQQQLLLEQALQKKIMAPVEDQKAEYQLVCIAKTNAQYSLASQSKEKNHGLSACEAVQNVLHLKKLPVRIECYDISNFQGDDAVGSRVVFIDGKPEKQHYRRYKIKTVQGANDFAMLKEVLLRRFSSSVEEQVPDLLIVDGGKGQLAQAQRVIQELDIQGVAIAGLAKARKQKETEERIFLPLRKDPVVLKKNTPEFFLLTHIRDEAHRFAVGYHKKLRDHV
jgi:excinuclease ABC subunit C